jgi:hypothetical protein
MILKKILIISSLCAVISFWGGERETRLAAVVHIVELPHEIIQAFINADAKLMSKYFNSSVELIFSESSGVYAKAQAEQILKTFFSNNASARGRFDYKHLHDSKRDNVQYYIGELHTGKGSYRVTIFMKNQLIHRMRIESND